MRCTACRGEYFTFHDCPGELNMGNVSRPSGGFLLGYYIGEALRIFRLDHLAIRRIEHDRESLLYSIPIWYVLSLLAPLALILLSLSVQVLKPDFAALAPAVLRALIRPFVLGAFILVQLVVFHFLARWFFSGQGTFIRVLRPYLLGSTLPVVFNLVPVVGTIIGGLWGMLIYAWIFEEVEGISRIQAIFISVFSSLLLMIFAGLIALR
jgi:hypothetical protein